MVMVPTTTMSIMVGFCTCHESLSHDLYFVYVVKMFTKLIEELNINKRVYFLTYCQYMYIC